MTTLRDLVDCWMENKCQTLETELDFFAHLTPDTENISRAARACGPGDIKLSHQRRLNNQALATFSRKLITNSHLLLGSTKFAMLYDQIKSVAKTIKGIGDLAIYDTSLRVGRRLCLAPDMVYLQAGAREGAKKLIKVRRGVRALPRDEFPIELQHLEPYQIENFLCVCKNSF